MTAETKVESYPEENSSFEIKAYFELETSVQHALETYSNVHRGSGHFSHVTTALYEKAREIVLDYLGLSGRKYTVIFCSTNGAGFLQHKLRSKDYILLSSKDIFLPLGIIAMAVRKTALPGGVPFQTGGSVARMVSSNYVIWAGTPQRFEAGTPMVINAISFAVALTIIKKYASECFRINNENAYTIKEILFDDELLEYSGTRMLHELKNLTLGNNMQVCVNDGYLNYINFDNAASTPAFLPVWNAVKKTWRSNAVVHKEVILSTRELIKSLLGTGDAYDVVFVCNTTEAINLAATFLKERYRNVSDTVILNTMLEHNANELPWRYIPGFSLIRLGIDNEGFIDVNELGHKLREYNIDNIYGNKRIRLVAISGASNVLGTFNDIEAVCHIAHKYGAEVLVDGAQMVAHRKVELEKWGVDFFAFSGHKVYAPFGSGALVIKNELLFQVQSIRERISLNGEENVVGIAALGKAITLIQRAGMAAIEESERSLLIHMLKGLTGIEELKVHGVSDPESHAIMHKGGIVSFFADKGNHKPLAKKIAEYGAVGLRYGCFCSHTLVKRLLGVSPALERFQNTLFTIAPPLADMTVGLVRVSFGIENDSDEIDRFIATLKKIINHKIGKPGKHNYDGHTNYYMDKENSKRYRKDLILFMESRMRMVYP